RRIGLDRLDARRRHGVLPSLVPARQRPLDAVLADVPRDRVAGGPETVGDVLVAGAGGGGNFPPDGLHAAFLIEVGPRCGQSNTPLLVGAGAAGADPGSGRSTSVSASTGSSAMAMRQPTRSRVVLACQPPPTDGH